MGRPFDKHIDNEELDALVPSSSESGQDRHRHSPDAVREAVSHVESCADCSSKVSKYRQLMHRSSNVAGPAITSLGADCPKDGNVDWHEVAAGLWPELKATQLIMHAALCDHCGPLLRAATSVDDDPTPQEEKLLAELKVPSRPVIQGKPQPIPPNPSPSWLQCTSGRVGLDCRSVKYDTAVITDTAFRAGVCKIRHKHSQAACSGKSCARRSRGLTADTQCMV